MNYDLIVAELKNASTFDLYRIHTAIGHLLDDPVRLSAIKRRLAPGMDVTYFNAQENRLIPAQVLEIRRTRVVIQDLGCGKRWAVPLYMINIEGADPDIAPKKNRIDRLSLKTGDLVGFSVKDGEDLFGTVIKLNPKRAKIQTGQGIWSVPYEILFTVIEGEQGQGQYIPAEIEIFSGC